MKRYTVIIVGTDYRIYDRKNDAYVGFFDTQKWAEHWAEVMEEENNDIVSEGNKR